MFGYQEVNIFWLIFVKPNFRTTRHNVISRASLWSSFKYNYTNNKHSVFFRLLSIWISNVFLLYICYCLFSEFLKVMNVVILVSFHFTNKKIYFVYGLSFITYYTYFIILFIHVMLTILPYFLHLYNKFCIKSILTILKRQYNIFFVENYDVILTTVLSFLYLCKSSC